MDIKSEVELQKDKVKVGMELIYSDNSNFQIWIVEDVNELGFDASSNDGDVDFFFFDELQFGWKFNN